MSDQFNGQQPQHDQYQDPQDNSFLFQVPDRAVDEGQSSFAAEEPQSLDWGAPAPDAEAEVAASAYGFANQAATREQDYIGPGHALRANQAPQPAVPPQVWQPGTPVPPVPTGPVAPQYAPPAPVAPVAAPQQYVAPVAPQPQVAPVAQDSNYAAPVAAPQSYIAPVAAPQQYVAPVAPQPQVAPVAQDSNYAAPVAAPPQSYAAPVAPPQQYAAPVAPPQTYAAPVTGNPQNMGFGETFAPAPQSYFAEQISDADFARPSATLEPSRKPKPIRKFIAGGLLGAVVLSGGTAYAAYEGLVTLPFLGGGGTQPEAVLPADAFGMIKLDLDPSVKQKVAAARLATKFPTLRKHASSPQDIKDSILGAVLDDSDLGLNYNTDVKPWVGDRIAAAGIPGGKTPHPVVVLAYHDKDKASAALKKAQAAARASRSDDTLDSELSGDVIDSDVSVQPASLHTAASSSDTFYYAFTKDYIVLSDTQAAADSVVNAPKHLTDNTTFTSDMSALAGDQIVAGWLDYGKVASLLPEDAADAFNPLAALGATATAGDYKPSGRIAVGVHVADDMVEMKSLARGIKQPAGVPALGTKPVSGDLAQRISSNALGGLSVSGLGDFATAMYKTFASNDTLGIAEQAQQYGLHPETDLAAIFGSNLTLAGTANKDASEFGAALLVKSPNPDRAAAVLTQLASESGEPDIKVRSDHKSGYALLFGDLGGGLVDHAPTLSSDPAYRKVIGNPGKAGAVIFVNLGKIIDLATAAGDDDDLKQVKAIGAIGMVANGSANDGSATLRVSFR